MLLLDSARRNSHVDPSKITALFEDPQGDYPRWLSVGWFKSSPDSPVNLEADPALAKYDTKWRHAFEDLLEAALDKPMTSREKFGYRGSIGPTSTWRGPGLDWMLSLQCRGILPPQLPTMYSNATAASELFATEGLSHTMLGRWCQQHSSASKPELWERVRIGSEYTELLEAIDTPAPEDTTFIYDKLEALGLPFRPVKTSTGECPDELGRAVSGAIESSHEPDTELDIYEQMYNDWVQDSTHQSDESEHSSSGARCPDRLGRAAGDAARQEAARAFADEENDLIGEERFIEWQQLQEGRSSPTGSDEYTALNGSTPSKTDSSRAVERMVEKLQALQLDQDIVNANHEFYLDQLAERLQALRDEHEELAEELADALEKLEHKSRMLERKDRQSSLVHPQNVAPAQADTDRLQVLSTLTTTETMRLPDGSVKTTVVLKRKFAGGLEETQESTQTSFEESSAPASVQEPSKKGWFWS